MLRHEINLNSAVYLNGRFVHIANSNSAGGGWTGAVYPDAGVSHLGMSLVGIGGDDAKAMGELIPLVVKALG